VAVAVTSRFYDARTYAFVMHHDLPEVGHADNVRSKGSGRVEIICSGLQLDMRTKSMHAPKARVSLRRLASVLVLKGSRKGFTLDQFPGRKSE
jgi:hypothetical protein